MTRDKLRERLREILLRSRGGEYPGWLDRVEGEILALLEQEPVVIVPASYVDAVEALVDALHGLQWSETWSDVRGMHQRCPICASGPPEHRPDCILRAALQQYREATGAEPKMEEQEVVWKRVFDEVASFYRKHGIDLESLVRAEMAVERGEYVTGDDFFKRLRDDIAGVRAHDSEAGDEEHDWGVDSYRCLRCGCNRDNATDQPCRG